MSDGPTPSPRIDSTGSEPGATERAIEREIDELRSDVDRTRKELGRTVFGQQRALREILVAVLAGGHVLLEGVPGVGKTLMVRSLARVLNLEFSRVQCTPDLIPADVTGTNVLIEDDAGGRHIRFQRGPIFAGMLLADEINRATPKTQSAFLEAMEERQVTVAGVSYPLPRPFIVLATQNPIEMEGTFPLPEAQLDRFLFKVLIDYPDRETLRRIAHETTGPERPQPRALLNAERIGALQSLARRIPIASDLLDAAVRLVRASHPDDPDAPDSVRRYVRYGASPRSARAIVLGAKVTALLEGRYHVSQADLEAVARPALRHRVLLNFDAGTSSMTSDDILSDVLKRVRS